MRIEMRSMARTFVELPSLQRPGEAMGVVLVDPAQVLSINQYNSTTYNGQAICAVNVGSWSFTTPGYAHEVAEKLGIARRKPKSEEPS